jgi:hypothetical protein
VGVFLDIEGAFINTSCDSTCAALVRHRIGYTIVRWIRPTQEGHLAAAAALNGSAMRDAVSRGCPQGGILSPLLWCLVVDDLIARLNGGGIYILRATLTTFVF